MQAYNSIRHNCSLPSLTATRRAPRASRACQVAAMQTRFVPAIVTPFQTSGALDKDAFQAYLKYLSDSGTQDIVVNGSTGEFPSMTLEEREAVVETARAAWPGRMVVNVSSTNVQDAIRLLHHAQQTKPHLKGDRCIADGVLLLPPYYFAASTDAGLENFFTAVIKEAKLPVYLYNFPANVNALISIQLFQRLAGKFEQLKGIKNTFDDMELQKEFAASFPDKQVYIGHDPSCLAALQAGLSGAIAASASIFPKHMVALAEAFENGDKGRAEELMRDVNKWNQAVEDSGVNIFAAVKACLSHRVPGFSPTVRPPLAEASADQKNQLLEVLKQIPDL